MIKYLSNNEIDKSKWDACNRDAFNGSEYANSWYLDIVSENWEALVDGDYDGIFPLIPGFKWGINYLYQPVFTQQLGLISKSHITENVVGRFLQSIPPKFKFAEINLNTLNKVNQGDYFVHYWQNFELDLIKTYDQLYKSYSENLKRNLKKSEKSGFSLQKNIKPEDIISLFRENRGKKVKGLGDADYLKLKRLSYKGIYNGLISTYGIYTKRNELCAGAIMLKNRNKIVFLFSGLSDEGKNGGAMVRLLDSIIKEYAQQQITLDFEGSNDPNLARFYHSFGSSKCIYPHIVINRLPMLIRFAVNSVKIIRKFV